VVVDNVMHIEIRLSILNQLMHREYTKGPTLNMGTRLLYLILLGLEVDNLVPVSYIGLMHYTGMSKNSIARALTELAGYNYIRRKSRGLYEII
jgi:hypothetical protein